MVVQMPQIYYYYSRAGIHVARWAGRNVCSADGPRKEDKVYRWRVASKAEKVFYKRGTGYHRFDSKTRGVHAVRRG